ncbi:hypothetical protein COOONC_28617, partial [Cooperia oncophora]
LFSKGIIPIFRTSDALPPEVAIVEPILRVLQLLCENHNNLLQNFIRKQSDRTNHNLVSDTLSFLDTVRNYYCVLYAVQRRVVWVCLEKLVSITSASSHQTLATLTEFCQGPCHENQVSMFLGPVTLYRLRLQLSNQSFVYCNSYARITIIFCRTLSGNNPIEPITILVSDTLSFLDTVCGSTKGSLGVFGEIGEHNFSLITQTTIGHSQSHNTENTMAMQENGLNIIISLVLNDIKPLADDHMELALEIKSQASKLLLAIMESRHDSENAERVLQNMDNTDGGPRQLMRRELLQRASLQDGPTSVVSPLIQADGVTLPEISVDSSGTVSIHDDTKIDLKYVAGDASTVDPKEVGHNIYILAHQLSRHSPELAQCLDPDDDTKSPQTKNALEFYKKHTAQIEIVRQDRTLERVVFPIHEICSFLTKETKQNVYNNTERDNQ